MTYNQRRKHVYLRAAKLMARGKETFSCNAVSTAAANLGFSRDVYVDFYNEIMGVVHPFDTKPYLLPTDIERAARGRTFANNPESKQRCRDFRTLMLCMMWACCNDMTETPDA